MMTASILFPASRQAFAMARDGALPFSKYLYKIDTWSGTPTRSASSSLRFSSVAVKN
jgi:amino acid transporter